MCIVMCRLCSLQDHSRRLSFMPIFYLVSNKDFLLCFIYITKKFLANIENIQQSRIFANTEFYILMCAICRAGWGLRGPPWPPPPPDGVVNTVLKQNSKIQKLQILPFVPQMIKSCLCVFTKREIYVNNLVWSICVFVNS